MPVPPPQPLSPPAWDFPPVRPGDDDVLGFGADLSPATLVHAYRHGIFPWPHDRSALPWFSPDPRALLFSHDVHVSRSLRATLRTCGWKTTVDTAFDEVVAACGVRPGEGTWITDEMRAAYGRLHRLGWAHSVEVWDGDGRLVGGIYGVAVGGCFTGESMFHRATGGSKVALVDLCQRWAEAGGAFVDTQLPTEHLTSMGAIPVDRSRFLSLLADVRDDLVLLPDDRRPAARLAPPPTAQ